MKNYKFLLLSAVLMFLIITAISLANVAGNNYFYLFYNLIYGLLLSTALPIYFTYKEKKTFYDLGIRKLKVRQFIVLFGFVIFSIGGQLINLDITKLRFDLLPVCIAPLIMTTFFEEFLFRGFIQIRIEKILGWIPAVLISGFCFSIYHLGYPGFRDVGDLLLLFAVGIGFALSFKLSCNNLIVSYFVNLPNAFLTYVLKSAQFPKFDNLTTLFAIITILIIMIMIICSCKYLKRINS